MNIIELFKLTCRNFYYREDVKLLDIEEFKKGVLHGKSIRYSDYDNTVELTEEYKNGERNGNSTHYREDGNVDFIDVFKKGKLIYTVQYYARS